MAKKLQTIAGIITTILIFIAFAVLITHCQEQNQKNLHRKEALIEQNSVLIGKDVLISGDTLTVINVDHVDCKVKTKEKHMDGNGSQWKYVDQN